MPILDTLPDPRWQIILDLTGQLQQARRQEEEERARSRERLRQRQIIGASLALGAVGGAIAAPAAAAAGGTAASGMMMGGAGAAASAGAGGGMLGSMLTGAGIGAQVGGALAQDDYGAAAQAGIQGVATMANLPSLQEQGYSPLEVAMGGAQGIPDILGDARMRRRQTEYATLRDAQVGRRQEENQIRQETIARRQRDEAFQQMPPHYQASIKTAENYIDRARIDLRRGEFGPPDSPQAQEAFNQAISPHLIEIEEARKWEPPPQPTIDQVIDEGKEISIRPELGGGFVRTAKGELKWFKTSPSFTALERAEMVEDKSREFELQLKDEQIAQLQQRIMGEGVEQKKAFAEAKKRIESDAAYAQAFKQRAQQAAEQYAERFMPASRLAYLRPTADENKQQQEAAKQQQEAAEQQQQAQQAAEQEQQQAQQLEQAQAVFSQSGQTLMSVAQEWGTAPSEWPKSRVEAARPSAEGFLQTLPVLLPMMTPEQSKEIKPIIVLATAIASQQRTLTIPELLPNEGR